MVSPPLLPAPKLSRHLRDRILGFLPFQPRPTALRHIGTETLAKSKFRNNLANVAFILFSSFSLLSLVPAPYYFRFDSLSGKLFACWRTTLCCCHFASVYLQWDSFEERERNRDSWRETVFQPDEFSSGGIKDFPFLFRRYFDVMTFLGRGEVLFIRISNFLLRRTGQAWPCWILRDVYFSARVVKSEILLSVCGDFLGIKVSAYKRYVTLKILSARFADTSSARLFRKLFVK